MRTVFFDVDTQLDFLYPAGALYVPGAERIVAAIARLNHWAAEHEMPVVSTADAHTEDDPEFRQWPHHCVAGTTGQQKSQVTLLDPRVVVPSAPTRVDLAGARQILIEKQTIDCFSNANLSDVLERLAADRYVVYGVVTEICVRLAVTGLLRTGRPVEIVSDAVRSLNDADATRTFEEFSAAGGRVTTVAAVCG